MSNAEADGSGTFRWTPALERKLLVLTQGRQLNGAEYERLLTVFPGTNLNGVRIRCSRLRGEQRRLFEEFGWAMDGPAPAVGKKGGAVEVGETKKRGAGEGGEARAAKKPRVKKGKKGGEIDGEDGKVGGGVKEEELEEEA